MILTAKRVLLDHGPRSRRLKEAARFVPLGVTGIRLRRHPAYCVIQVRSRPPREKQAALNAVLVSTLSPQKPPRVRTRAHRVSVEKRARRQSLPTSAIAAPKASTTVKPLNQRAPPAWPVTFQRTEVRSRARAARKRPRVTCIRMRRGSRGANGVRSAKLPTQQIQSAQIAPRVNSKTQTQEHVNSAKAVGLANTIRPVAVDRRVPARHANRVFTRVPTKVLSRTMNLRFSRLARPALTAPPENSALLMTPVVSSRLTVPLNAPIARSGDSTTKRQVNGIFSARDVLRAVWGWSGPIVVLANPAHALIGRRL